MNSFRKRILKLASLKSTIAACVFAGIFVVLSLDLVADERTYMIPPSVQQADNQVSFWLNANGLMNPRTEVLKNNLVEYMSSEERYAAHRTFLVILMGGYVLSAVLIWRRNAAALTAIAGTFVLKIVHGVFFIWTGYLGRKVSADLVGSPTPPLVVWNPAETYYLGGIALAVLVLLYFYLVKRRQKAHSLLLRF